MSSYDLSNYLVVGISSRALFELSKENKILEEGLEAYSKYQIEHEDDNLKPGIGFSLVSGLLRLNKIMEGNRKTEVIIMSRNNTDTSLRIFNSIEHYNLAITRAVFTSGSPLAPYLKALKVDLFLSAEEEDIQDAINAGMAAGLIYNSDTSYEIKTLNKSGLPLMLMLLYSQRSQKRYNKMKVCKHFSWVDPQKKKF